MNLAGRWCPQDSQCRLAPLLVLTVPQSATGVEGAAAGAGCLLRGILLCCGDRSLRSGTCTTDEHAMQALWSRESIAMYSPSLGGGRLARTQPACTQLVDRHPAGNVHGRKAQRGLAPAWQAHQSVLLHLKAGCRALQGSWRHRQHHPHCPAQRSHCRARLCRCQGLMLALHAPAGALGWLVAVHVQRSRRGFCIGARETEGKQ